MSSAVRPLSIGEVGGGVLREVGELLSRPGGLGSGARLRFRVGSPRVSRKKSLAPVRLLTCGFAKVGKSPSCLKSKSWVCCGVGRAGGGVGGSSNASLFLGGVGRGADYPISQWRSREAANPHKPAATSSAVRPLAFWRSWGRRAPGSRRITEPVRRLGVGGAVALPGWFASGLAKKIFSPR